MFGQYSDICIRGIVSAVPENRIDNMKLVKSLGTKRTKRQDLSARENPIRPRVLPRLAVWRAFRLVMIPIYYI